MSNAIKKGSQIYKEDIQNNFFSYMDFKKLNQELFTDEIPNQEEAIEILNKLKQLKKLIKERLTNFQKSSQNHENKNNNIALSKENKLAETPFNTPKNSFIEIYKKHLKLKDYKDLSLKETPENFQTKSRSIIAKFLISKEILILKIKNMIEPEGRKSLNVLLKHENISKSEIKLKNNHQIDKDKKEFEDEQELTNGIILTYDTNNDEEDIFNITQAKNLIKIIYLEIIDNRDIKFVMKDLTIAMIRILEEKFGKLSKNGIGYGITHRILEEIFKIKKPEKTNIIRESDTSNKEADSVQSEKGGYEDDLEYEYEDEDQY